MSIIDNNDLYGQRQLVVRRRLMKNSTTTSMFNDGFVVRIFYPDASWYQEYNILADTN